MDDMTAPATVALQPSRLRRRCDPRMLEASTMGGIRAADSVAAVGQARAVAAIELAAGIAAEGFNLFVIGSPGVSRREVVESLLRAGMGGREAPSDWCYVNNFSDPQRPRALRLPRGRGLALREAMDRVVQELQATIPAAFESDDYRQRVEHAEREVSEQQRGVFESVASEASAQGLALVRVPEGFTLAPAKDHEVLSPEAFEALPQAERERIAAAIAGMQERLQAAVARAAEARRRHFDQVRRINEEVTAAAVAAGMADVRKPCADLPDVLAYLAAVERDIAANGELFRRRSEAVAEGMPAGAVDGPSVRRYRVNLLVDETGPSVSGVQGVPVLHEENPTCPNLIGRIEHLAQFGALLTDFNLIRSGALHRANGGCLMLDAARVLGQPFAWDALKRALIARQVRVETPGQQLGLVSTVSLEPEPIPLDVKVVLFGDLSLYQLLHAFDPDFPGLFKVAADFSDDMPREAAAEVDYARALAALSAQRGLPPLDRTALARLVEEAARAAGDAQRLSLDLARGVDLVAEAAWWARREGRTTLLGPDIEQATRAREQRLAAPRERLLQAVASGELLIRTRGSAVGQVNGLSVQPIGDQAFVQPARITATARLGEGQLIDIQRETALGGSIHSKGVLILSGYLASRYSARRPLSLAASLVLEQTYGRIEGDSASLAELCALISALSGVELRQGLAVTGSVDQHGAVQAIGAVNEKIEGFFDLCVGQGLSGEQGVVIPAGNASQLMLKEELIAAVESDRFSVHAVSHVDEALALLTGWPAGDPALGANAQTVNGRVMARLREFHELRREQAGARRWPAPGLAGAGETEP